MTIKIEDKLHLIFGERLRTNQEDIEQYSLNPGGFQRVINAVVQPKNTTEIQELIKLANEYKTALYPISTGKNWGYGSKLPVKNGAIVVDLSGMDKILEINTSHGYAVIEPGVTQGQLSDYLVAHDLPFLVNVTGSGRDTSIMGNTLDRGDGYFNLRVDDIRGMEVVLGTGEVLHTGFGHYEKATANYLYPHGIGPSLNGLFSQSNFGIVTKIAFSLVPKHELHAAVLCGLKNEADLGDFMEDIADLKKQGIWSSIIHVGNKLRSQSTLIPILTEHYHREKKCTYQEAKNLATDTIQSELNNAWSGIGAIYGTKEEVNLRYKIIRKKLCKYGNVTLLTDKKIAVQKRILKRLSKFSFFERKYALASAIEPLFGIAKGIPSDVALQSLHWQNDKIPNAYTAPESTGSGVLFITPIIPLESKYVIDLLQITKNVFTKYGFIPYITINTFTPDSAGAVINLLFDKNNSAASTKAHGCIHELGYLYREKGYLPYRISIDEMPTIMEENDTFWQYVRQLKKVFDPNGIIAPGRYSLPRSTPILSESIPSQKKNAYGAGLL